ncbi:hypothetical protein EDB82DRAFT_61259 [Fusarium venenatum]|uniref:uncharacterized protein n=1 Tax=Fusarium venenatum TaxID=56646 RepID=UPI001D6F9558|nr:hypothetical protein EDB82DRAFT_61259 [Fusarium venenatum]
MARRVLAFSWLPIRPSNLATTHKKMPPRRFIRRHKMLPIRQKTNHTSLSRSSTYSFVYVYTYIHIHIHIQPISTSFFTR